LRRNTKVPRKPRVTRPAPTGFMRVPEFAREKHLGLNQTYNAVKNGELAHVTIGRSIFVAEDALERRLAQQQEK
jgi:hypothetical protein